jgi:hypothetical protein
VKIKPRGVARGVLFEDAPPELRHETAIRRGLEWKQPDDRIDRHVVVEQPEPGETLQLETDGHLADSGRAEDDDECHVESLVRAGVSGEKQA